MRLKTIFFLIFYMSFVAEVRAQKYFNQTDFGPLFGRVESWEGNFDPRLNFSFNSFHGVKILPAHAVGFSIGVDTYPGLTVVPLAIGWRGFRERGRKFTWFAGMDVGAGSMLLQQNTTTEWSESWYEGGIMISPSVGVRKNTKKGTHAFVWSLGFRRQEASFNEGFFDFSGNRAISSISIPPGFSSMLQETYAFNSFFFKWGLMF